MSADSSSSDEYIELEGVQYSPDELKISFEKTEKEYHLADLEKPVLIIDDGGLGNRPLIGNERLDNFRDLLEPVSEN